MPQTPQPVRPLIARVARQMLAQPPGGEVDEEAQAPLALLDRGAPDLVGGPTMPSVRLKP